MPLVCDQWSHCIGRCRRPDVVVPLSIQNTDWRRWSFRAAVNYAARARGVNKFMRVWEVSKSGHRIRRRRIRNASTELVEVGFSGEGGLSRASHATVGQCQTSSGRPGVKWGD